ncbi:MAG: alpha/beta fold hydrolase [Pseudoxanthomonas sp.]
MVTVESRGPAQYVASKRGDVLTTGELGDASREMLRVAGLDPGACQKAIPGCVEALRQVGNVNEERRLATLSELLTMQALALTPKEGLPRTDQAMDAWLQAARYAYAYLFFSPRTPSQRAFEDRQTQVRDYYNYATQRVVSSLFDRWHAQAAAGQALAAGSMPVGGWTVTTELGDFRLPGGVGAPDAVIPASMLAFEGLRSTYRRDGFGAEMVAEVAPSRVGDPSGLAPPPETAQEVPAPKQDERTFSELPYAPATLLLRFEGADLQPVLASQAVTVVPYDPYRQAEIDVHGQRVPLAANYTAAYGLWLARSGFAAQSLRSMLGRERGIDHPHLYLMQPYDPDRRILLMLHGLGSSPEAWVNVANEIMGDEQLRRGYQIWQVYYPTNMPLAWNRSEIQQLVAQTLQHFDPDGRARASRDMVLIGHSMGGVLGRLLLTSSNGDQVWNTLTAGRNLDSERGKRARQYLKPLLTFEPLPQVDHAIFIAAPHRGTQAAETRLGRFVGRLVRLPVRLLDRFTDALKELAGGEADGPPVVPNSIDNLRDSDPFVRAVAELPVSSRVGFNTIIAQRDPAVPLLDSDDGLVPYRSAHLEGAESEKIILGGHSIQESPQAILEIRRILHQQLEDQR